MPLLASGRWNNSSVLTRLKTTAILYQKEKLQLDFLKNICLKYKQHNFLTHIIIIFRPVTLKWGSVKFDIRKMLCTFSFGCFQIHQNKRAKNIGIYFIGIFPNVKVNWTLLKSCIFMSLLLFFSWFSEHFWSVFRVLLLLQSLFFTI